MNIMRSLRRGSFRAAPIWSNHNPAVGKPPLCFTFCLALLALSLEAAPLAECYRLEEIALPAGIPPEVGAMTFDGDGTLHIVLRRGDVIAARPVADPQAFAWRAVATGFDNPGGIVVPTPGRLLVSQFAEITEAVDTDGDGRADRYRALANDWGLSGNYQEHTSLCEDGAGGAYLALATGSFAGPTFLHTRGEFSAPGRRGRNFSAVKYRGWVMHLRADGKLEPFASGFRVLNGMLRDAEGNIWSADQQGDWKAVTPLYHITKDKFYGHPNSLIWDPAWPAGKDPFVTFYDDLPAYNAHRTRPAVEVPHAELCRSAAELAQFPRDGAFGPFAGQLLLPDNTVNRIARIMLDRVDGEFQGTATMFMEGMGLRAGNNRLRFSPDGRALYIGVTSRGWGTPSEGLQRLHWRGGTPFTIEMVTITPEGFRVTFTARPGPDALAAASYGLRSMVYQPRWTYGSAPEDVTAERVTGVASIGERTVHLTVGVRPGRVYHLRLGENVRSDAGESPPYRDFYYTANRVPKR